VSRGIARRSSVVAAAALLLIAAFAPAGDARSPIRRGPAPVDCNPACNTAGIPDCCAGQCTSLMIDSRNCGACGRDCLALGRVCEDADCVVGCVPPMVREGERCVLRCDPPCAPDEICNEYGTGTLCCAAMPSEERWFQCRDTCCGPGLQCCDGYCCAPGMQCCNGKCCPLADVCRDEPGPDGSPCCAPANICDGVCCTGERSCAADGHCRPACNPSCGAGAVCCDPGTPPRSVAPTPASDARPGRPAVPAQPGYTVPGGGGRCVAIPELCNGDCCPRNQRCGADSHNPEQRVCCHETFQWCNGTCCADGESCEGGNCVVQQTECEPACGEGQSCCTNLVCCECCADPDYQCGRMVDVKTGGGQPVRACVPKSAPPGEPWLDPTGCKTLQTSTIHYQGIGGRCTGTLIACAHTVEVSCPFHSMAVAFSEPGPVVCCERFEDALRAPGPRSCDPAGHDDCDNNR